MPADCGRPSLCLALLVVSVGYFRPCVCAFFLSCMRKWAWRKSIGTCTWASARGRGRCTHWGSRHLMPGRARPAHDTSSRKHFPLSLLSPDAPQLCLVTHWAADGKSHPPSCEAYRPRQCLSTTIADNLPPFPFPPQPSRPRQTAAAGTLSLPMGETTGASHGRKKAGIPAIVFPRPRELHWRGGGGTTPRGNGCHVSVGRGWGSTSWPTLTPAGEARACHRPH